MMTNIQMKNSESKHPRRGILPSEYNQNGPNNHREQLTE